MKKIDDDITNLKKQTIKREKKSKRIVDWGWVIRLFIISFFISFGFSCASELIIPNVDIFVGIIIVLLFIFIGIIFDMIGMSVASANEVPFHSMGARKVKGAKMAINMIKNSDKVSSFCNDVIGDICGIVSGSAGSIVSLSLSSRFGFNPFFTTLICMAIISSLTIGGKAIFKSYAINKSNVILYRFCSILAVFKRNVK